MRSSGAAALAYRSRVLAPGLMGLSIYQHEWRTTINCYVLARRGAALMIDTGRQADAPALEGALRLCLEGGPAAVADVVASHGHGDHVGGIVALPHAQGWIHAADLAGLAPEVRARFAALDSRAEPLAQVPLTAALEGLDALHLGGHTPGSIAIYDPLTRALLTGDQPCFFREPFPPEGMVVPAAAMRERMLGFVRRWARAPRRVAVRLGSLDHWLRGMAKLSELDAALLCTGHGPVLAGDIGGLLAELVDAGGSAG